MPTYEFLHDVEECKHEWEDFRSITAADPTHCPKCNAEGNIVHLISGGSGKGVVELYGAELIEKCKADGKKIAQEASKNEQTYANLLGADRYQALQTRLDNQKKDGKVKRR
jgi:hypothetical protein